MSQREMPPLLRLAGAEAAFSEPWQAQAFAITVALHQNGLFSWSEWTASLSSELKDSDATEKGNDYYRGWLSALEKLLGQKEVAGRSEIDTLTAAWQRAAHATPHGKPILLENDPQAGERHE